MGDLNHFLDRLEKCRRQILASGLQEALVIHHDEADGLTSAALSKLALERLGLETRLICLDKLYPEVVAGLESGPRRVLAYSDIGSGHIGWLGKHNESGSLILTLDHHDTMESVDPLVMNLNPELDGFSGETEASSATVAYFFAKSVDRGLRRFSHLALIGSTEVPGEPQGLNELVLKDVEEERSATRSGRGDFKIQQNGMSFARSRMVAVLNVLGSVGYYQDGPSRGVKACVEGFDRETLEFAKGLEEKRKAANQNMLAEVRADGLSQGRLIQWFHAHDNYSGMSGKVVGSFCSYLRYQRVVNPMKYLMGMMNVPAEIPGWGKLPAPLVKVSGRLPPRLASLVEKGDRPALSRILPEACSQVGGFGDGHSVAASGVFPVGQEEQFLDRIERLAAG